MALLSELCYLLGDTERAVILEEMLRPYAHLNLTSLIIWFCLGSGSHYLGLLSTTRCRWDDAERYFDDALTMHRQMGATLFLTRTRCAYAGMLALRDTGADRERARALVNQALRDADAHGMTRLAREARTIASSVVQGTPKETHGLSAREIDVLRLIVEGKTDREIADSLFISHRTVMRHVTSILNKLGVTSRTAAATVAIRSGIV